jgi:hypothetical protein
MSVLLDLADELRGGLVILATLILSTWAALGMCCCGCRAARTGIKEFFTAEDELSSKTPAKRALSAMREASDQWLAEKIRDGAFKRGEEIKHPFIEELATLHAKAVSQEKEN